ncbi:zinc ribbon domain-containing protein [Enterocloster asparagiformis]|uniref:zinc ribbon domain-containing protein n=1 Tax=Enterocloster asparagiformis TaxID=333367 RepID=UPI002A7ED0AB|nr:zinc-ribbon domain-containing protein [Enterocloster asparagiformis]
MYCTKCGAEMPDDALFCTACGEKIDHEDEAASETTESGNKEKMGKRAWNRTYASDSRKAPKKGMKIALIAAAGIAVCGLAAGVVLLNQPKAVIARGVKNTWKAICTEESGVPEYLGLRQISRMVDTGKSRRKAELAVSVGPQNMGIGLADVGLSGWLEKDDKGRLLGRLSGTMGEMEMAGLDFYHDEEKTVAGSPELYSEYFYVDHQELKEKLEDSKFRALLEEEFGIDWEGELDTERLDLLAEYWDVSREDWKALIKNMDVAKIDKRTFTVGGKDKACQGYELTIDRDDIRQVLEDMDDVMLNNSMLVNAAAEAAWTSPEDMRRQLKEISKRLLGALKNDLVLQVYVGPKGRIVCVEGDYSLNGEVISMSLNGSLELTGKKNPLDTVYLEAEGKVASLAAGKLTFSRELNDSGNMIKDNVNLGLSATGAGMFNVSAKAEANASLNKEKGRWNAEASLTLPGVQGSASANGTVGDLAKGKQFVVTLDDASVGAYGLSMPFVGITASYGVEPLKEEIVDPTEDVKLVNVLKLTRDDLNEIGSEIGNNAGSGGFAFPGMGGKSVPASTTAPCTEAPETKAYDSGY